LLKALTSLLIYITVMVVTLHVNTNIIENKLVNTYLTGSTIQIRGSQFYLVKKEEKYVILD
jgi:hypothetical protein